MLWNETRTSNVKSSVAKVEVDYTAKAANKLRHVFASIVLNSDEVSRPSKAQGFTSRLS